MTDIKSMLLNRMNVNNISNLQKENEELKLTLAKYKRETKKNNNLILLLKIKNNNLKKELKKAKAGIKSKRDEYLDRVSLDAETTQEKIIDKLVMKFGLSHNTKGISIYFKNKGIPTKKKKTYYLDHDKETWVYGMVYPRMRIIHDASMKSSIPEQDRKAISVYATSLLRNGSSLPGGTFYGISNLPEASPTALEDMYNKVRKQTITKWRMAIEAIDNYFKNNNKK